MKGERNIKNRLEGKQAFSTWKMTSISIIVFICFLLGHSTVKAQSISWAAVPCEALSTDTTWMAYLRNPYPIGGSEKLKLLNEPEIKACMGKNFLDATTSKNELPEGLDSSAIYILLVEETGRVMKTCHLYSKELHDDRFQIVNCLEKMRFGISGKERMNSKFYRLIIVQE